MRRRPVSAALLAFALVLGLSTAIDRHEPTTSIAVAARDLASGHALTSDDIVMVDIPTRAVASTSVTTVDQVVGRVLTGPVAALEPITTTRVVSATSTGGLSVPIRLIDAGAARWLRPGDLVDVMAAASRDGEVAPAQAIARRVRVISISTDEHAGPFDDGALILVAADAASAPMLAGASGLPLTVVIHPG
jgi:Flp pilus assembly protein CpaB